MKYITWFVSLLSIFTVNVASAQLNCSKENLAKNPHQVLRCYIAQPEHIPNPWALNNKQTDANNKVLIETYTLSSLRWQKTTANSNDQLWQHTLVIYRPLQIKTDRALLFVNGGTRNMNADGKNPPPAQLDFARIATTTQSIVADLHDIPNQYLTFSDNIPRKEDGIVAYTWNQYLSAPDRNMYWSVHLPMTKAVVKAMDAVQQIAAQNYHTKIKSFVVSGASKRGWVTWLAALADSRIQAIVPIVIDILNSKANIDHIYASYNDHFPPAFGDYVAANIPEQLNTPAFTQLMNIEDPIAYLNCKQCAVYKNRLTLPKYIISASGDDFFVPDSLNLYLNKLPGETRVRVVPNQPHYIDMKIVEDALLTYYRSIIDAQSRPLLSWRTNRQGALIQASTDAIPTTVKLWQATNSNARDFRLAAKITYTANELTGKCTAHQCVYPIKADAPTQGWKAHFVEFTFMQPNGEELILTTPAYVIGAV